MTVAALAIAGREPGQALTGAAISGVALCEGRLRRASILWIHLCFGYFVCLETPTPTFRSSSMTESSEPQSGSEGNYVVVARRYRPLGFDQLVGQDAVSQALKNAIETNRVGHAYLFTGARGVGKTSTARIFAKALNDPGGPTATPDNESDVAQAIDSGEDVDVIEIDGASNRGIDEIRSLRANVGVRPSRSRYKIYIIDEVHMLTGAAFNALLKTLEEPPEHVKFIFCTTDPEKIPITVLSRCQRFDFAPVEVAKIMDRLREIVSAEGAEADDAALELLARRAAGSMRDSQSLLEQVLSFCDGKLTADQVHAMLGTADDQRLHALAQAMSDRDAAEALRQMDAGIDAGVDAGRLAEQLLGYFRDLMAVAVGSDPSMLRHTSASLHDDLKLLADHWGLQTVLAVVGLIDQTLVRIRHSVYARVLLESAVIQICNLPDLQRLADLTTAATGISGNPATKSPKRGVEKKKVAETKQDAVTTIDGPTVPKNRSTAHAPHTPGPRHHLDHPSAGSSSVAVASTAATETAVLDQPWNQQTVDQLWQESLGGIDPMTEALARSVERVEAAGDATLRLVFAAESNLAMSRCDLPEHKNAIADAVSQSSGRKVVLELVSDGSIRKPAAPAKKEKRLTGKERVERMRQIESHPMIRACIEHFEADVVKIDEPR